jgi:hypothetical protein
MVLLCGAAATCVLAITLWLATQGHRRALISLPVIPGRAFGFASLQDHVTLSGEQSIEVRLPGNYYQYGDVGVYIDGKLHATGGQMTGPSMAELFTTVEVRTAELPNGQHTVEVKDHRGNRDTRTVRFENRAHTIGIDGLFNTTNSDGLDAPRVCIIKASLDKKYSWIVKVQNGPNTTGVIKAWSGRSNSIWVSWDGKARDGKEVADGPYSVLILVEGAPAYRAVVNKLGDRQ